MDFLDEFQSICKASRINNDIFYVDECLEIDIKTRSLLNRKLADLLFKNKFEIISKTVYGYCFTKINRDKAPH